MSESGQPVLSVVNVVVSDTVSGHAHTRLMRESLKALQAQEGVPSMEVVVPYHEDTDGIDALRSEFPDMRFILVEGYGTASRPEGDREHHDALRARGMREARGRYIALLEDHGRPAKQWAASLIKAHEGDLAGVGGAIENGVDKALNWAVYFCDFSRYQNPVPGGISDYASDANTAYKREALESVQDIWGEAFQEVIVNQNLARQGKHVGLVGDAVVYQHREGLSLGEALKERYSWGRSYAITRSQMMSTPKRLIFAALSPAIPVAMMVRLAKTAWQRKRNFGKFVTCLPVLTLLLIWWSVGEAVGYMVAGSPNAKPSSHYGG